jgi:hypothetical protein
MMDFHLPRVMVGGRHVSYYVAVGTVLLVAWLFRWRRSQQPPLAHVPFYKAGKTKWMFDAETAILDSYSKVSRGRQGRRRGLASRCAVLTC